LPSIEFVFLDTAPGGAGHARRLGERFGLVLTTAFESLDQCTCLRACHRCLTAYTNQMHHDKLNRHHAAFALGGLIGRKPTVTATLRLEADRLVKIPTDSDASASQILARDSGFSLQVVASIPSALHDVLVQLRARGVAWPVIGYELMRDDGECVEQSEVAWPDEKVCVLSPGASPNLWNTAGWQTLFMTDATEGHIADILRPRS
jgi:hypothetical protein